MKRITSTQYLKKGDKTNVGIVKQLHEYKAFTTTDGFYYNLDETEIYKVQPSNINPIFQQILKPFMP